MSNRHRWLVIFLSIIFGAFHLFFAIFQPLAPDDGTYLLAARELYSGQVPYRDFFTNQGPCLLAVYGVSQVIYPGLLSGRLLAVLLSFLAFLLAGRIARTHSGQQAQLLTLAILACNPVLMNYQVKTYPITALLLLLTFRLSFSNSFSAALLGGIFISLTLLTRLSTAPLALGMAVTLGLLPKPRSVIRLVLVLAGLLPVFVVGGILVASGAGPNLHYDALTFHRLRPYNPMYTFSWQNKVLLLRDISDYLFPMIGALVLSLCLGGKRFIATLLATRSGQLSIIAVLLCLISFGSIMALPFTTFFGYLLEPMPLLALSSSMVLTEFLKPWTARQRLGVLIPFIAWLVLNPLRLSTDFIVKPLNRYRRLQQTPITQIQTAAKVLNSYVPENGTLMTLETALAVESGLRVFPGMEGGSDCYVPQWTSALCTTRRVVNDYLLLEALETGAVDAVAFSDPDWQMFYEHRSLGHGRPLRHPYETAGLPTITRELVAAKYRYLGSIKTAGQWQADLHLYIKPELTTVNDK